MKRTLVLVELIGFVVVLSLQSAHAQTARQTRGVLDEVKELDKPVTFTETKIPLGELVEKVARDTGVTLTATRDVSDEPVAVIVKELPARQLLDQLADLLDYRWSRRTTNDERPTTNDQRPATNGKGDRSSLVVRRSSVRYEIWQDVASKQREEALRKGTFADVERRFQEQLQRILQAARQTPEQIKQDAESMNQLGSALAKMTPDQRQAFMTAPETQERMQRVNAARQVGTPIPRALAGVLSQLTPQQWALLRGDQQIIFSSDPQPGELRLPTDTARSFRAGQPTMFPPGAQPRFNDSTQEERMRQQEKQMQEQWAAATGYRVTLRLDVRQFQTGSSLFLNAGASPTRGGGPGQGFFFGGQGASLYVNASATDPMKLSVEDTPERRAALEKDPIIGAKKLFKPETKPRPQAFGPPGQAVWRSRDLLPDLARAYGVNLIADAYSSASRSFFAFPAASTEPTALFTLLDRYLRYSSAWDHVGTLIRIRSRTWFFDRPREIPMRLTRRWKSLLEQNGALPLEEYLTMATSLSDAQLETLGNLVQDGEVPSTAVGLYQVSSGRHVLRLYASLSPMRRQALWAGGALSVAQMTPPEQQLFIAALQERNRSRNSPLNLSNAASGGLTLTAVRGILTIDERAGGRSVRFELLPPPGAPGSAPTPAAGNPPAAPPSPAPPAQAQRPPGTAVPADSLKRIPVTQLRVQLQYGAETPENISLNVLASGPE